MIRRLLIAIVLFVVGGCDGCGSPVATLRGVEETVEGRVGGSDWQAVRAGRSFYVEDAVRTGGASSARVHLIGAGDLRLGEHTMLVFHPGRAEAFSTLIELEAGELVLSSGEGPMQLLTEIGELILERDSEARVIRADGETRVHVAIGRATIEGVGQEAIDLGVLDTVVIGPDGEATVERAEAETTTETPTETEARNETDTATEPEPESDTVSVTILGRPVSLQRAPGAERETLEAGERVLPRGATLTVPRGARVTAATGDASVSARGRAQLTIPDEGLLTIDIGAAEIMTGGTEAKVAIPGGVVRTSGGRAAASLAVERGRAELSVTGGRVFVETERGSQELRAGDSVQVTPAGVVTALDRAPTTADLEIAAGESATIHDAKPPTTVRVAMAGCDETVVATVGVRRFEGDGGAIIPVRGNTRYEVRCGDGPPSSGTLRTRRDNGRAPLLRSAPHTRVDSDGRTYRVLYQNLLPEVEVRWRDAPEANGYRLEIESPGGNDTVRTRAPRHTFASGELREGSHRFRFVAGEERSATGTIVIAFDNAAPAVFVREPADGTLAAGSSATVSGQLLEGFSASIAGEELNVDRQGRFSTEAAVPSDGRALTIRAVHPSHGVHYYLRHAAGASE